MNLFELIKTKSLLLCLLVCTMACKESVKENPSTPAKTEKVIPINAIISRETYHDKLLGMLIGSAIGDAMGAPTEMWQRSDIRKDYGIVNGLDSMMRSPSAEGTWLYNLPAGGTTDDTRWKQLTVQYLLDEDLAHLPAQHFARYLVHRYQKQIQNLKKTEGFAPEPFEQNLMKMAWLQEWAMVARPYAHQDIDAYAHALNKFYGGEMTCAGMLYAPVLGAVRPSAPGLAYDLSYDHAIFDIGYARDMTGLIAAMVAAAIDTHATPQSILNVNKQIDPQGYFKSRLVGRSAYRFYQYAHTIDYETSAMTDKDIDKKIPIPAAWQQLDTLAFLRLRKAYDMLDAQNEDVAFHPGEIYLTVLTAMMFCDFDFEKTMTFIVNYGRDNDTAGAIAGAILGAYWGADKLPVNMKQKVLAVNKQQLNIDLEQLASQLTEKYFSQTR